MEANAALGVYVLGGVGSLAASCADKFVERGLGCGVSEGHGNLLKCRVVLKSGIVVCSVYYYNSTVTDSAAVAFVVFLLGNSVTTFAVFRKVGASVANAFSGVSFPGSVFSYVAFSASKSVENFVGVSWFWLTMKWGWECGCGGLGSFGARGNGWSGSGASKSRGAGLFGFHTKQPT